MTPTAYLIAVTGLLLSAVCVALIAASYRKTGELLSPWILFLMMSLLDFYLPAALFVSTGLDVPPWLSPLAGESAMPSLLLFTAGAAFFLLGYSNADGEPMRQSHVRRPSTRRVELLACLIAALFLLSFSVSVSRAGGLSEYLSTRLADRFAAPVVEDGWMHLLSSLAIGLVPTLFVLAGVAFGERRTRPLSGILIPLIAAAAATTLLLRGVFLTLLIGLAIVERSRLHDLISAGVPAAAAKARMINRRIVLACALGVFLFVTYGALRNYFTWEAYSEQATITHAVGTELSRFVRGEGFVGLMGVMHAYPKEVPFFMGRTIRDMLLLPIPRAIWPSKPAWYGIDDITRAMGWPSSTMSAITMPGELYANFSIWGIPLMWLYGWFFGAVRRLRFGSGFRYIYAFAIVPMMLPTFWMAFTGFVNQLVPIPFMILALWFVFRGQPSVAIAELGPDHAL